MLKNSKEGAQTTIHLAVSEDVKGVSGTYIANKPYGCYTYILYIIFYRLIATAISYRFKQQNMQLLSKGGYYHNM